MNVSDYRKTSGFFESRPSGNWFYRFFRVAAVFVLAVAVLGAKTEAAYAILCLGNPTSYRMTFEGNFNEESSPGSLPTPHVRFTQVIWGTHNSQVKFWDPGAMASFAVEAVAEEGVTFHLSNEFIAARKNMARWGFFPKGRYPGGEETHSITIELCKEAPLFTGLAMLDFSPDWFVGLSSYSLLDSEGNWIPSRTVNLYPYDAGTEQGSEYSLNNAPSDPYQPITSIKGKGKFQGATAPVAKMKFELINPVNLGVRVGGTQLKTVRRTEGSGQFSVTATLGSVNTSGGALSIPIRSGSGTTAQAGDYTVAGSISIASNARSGSTTFEVTDDSNDEPTETVFLEPGSSLPAGIAAGGKTKIIIDDNDATVVSLERSDTGAVAEGGAGAKENAEFTVTLGRELVAGERVDVPLALSGAGVTADDLESLSEKSGEGLNTGVTLAGADTLTPTVIFQGAGAGTATVVLTPGDDDLAESDETLTVALGPDGSGEGGFDHSSLGTNVGGGADPHSSSKSFDVVIESEDVTVETPKTTSPLVSISGGSSVTEGGTATFTLSASPAPQAAITVNVSVVESGAFAGSGQTGSREVTVPAGGKASLTVTTRDDSTDESDGSITATLADGSGYSVGSPRSASVTVKDNDVPAVSVSGGPPVTEGGTATFTLSASPAPQAGITVNVSVVESGAFAGSGQTGSREVTVPAGGKASLTVTTRDDSTDESDGSITATLADGSGYSVGSPRSASVTVKDNDVPAVSVSGGPPVTEGGTATFTLSASPAPAAGITVNVSVVQSGAFAGSRQTGLREVTIPAGDDEASLTVTTRDDSTDEPDGSIRATVTSAGQSYLVSSTAYTASVAVKDNDGLPGTSDDNDGLPPSTVSDPGDSNYEPSPDRRILVAVYNTAGGGGWTWQGNWITAAPVVTWYGVVADLEDRVTGLILEDNNLEGGISGDIGELDKLEVLYMNNNNLEGAIPLAQLGGLESLEELALWGNEGLTGTIPDELGKRVDRAVLRKIKEVNGVSVLEDWFTGDDAVFDYSGWREVEVNGNDRVSGLDLSGVGVSGDVTEAIWALSDIEELDLSDNPGLSGEVPLAVMDGKLEFLDISGTDVCVPQDEDFELWLESIDFTNSDSDNCGEVGNEAFSAREPLRVERDEPAEGGGGGGCSVASGSGFKRSVPGFVLAVFVLLTAFLAGIRDA